MKNSPGKGVAGRTPGAVRKRSKERQIVLLDQRPLRRQAASECSRAMARLDKVRAEWKRFEHEDKPGFERWMAATFGALLSRLRETGALVREKEALVGAVEMEMLFGGARSYRTAYATVQRRRRNPSPEAEPRAEAPPPPMEADDDGFPGAGPDLPEFEQELLFEDFLRVVLGLNPDRMSQTKYEKMFADFKANVLGQAPPEPPAQPRSAPEPPPEQSRIKELYRLLVRRLHPDTRAASAAEVSMVWHEVQEAYRAGNLERLEMLLALTDLQSNSTGEHTSLFQMRAVLTELRRSFNALQRNLRAAKKELAWNFARWPDRSALEKRVRGELESSLACHEGQLSQLEALIASWSAPPQARKRPAPRRQEQFPF